MSNKENREKLQKLLLENPDCELRFFVSDSLEFDYSCIETYISNITIDYLALYTEEQWLDSDDYEEALYNVMGDDFPNDELGQKKLEEAVSKEMKKVNFEKIICVWLG